ncbi:MAG TPA: hypothetical protein VFN92_02410 [Solirubrobacterales bacterium]|nr:hypothetical protein [Solirubrobacterales bacterium]
MFETRLAVGRTVALGLLLALSVLLLGAAKAEAGRYGVAQCGWYAGADASWADTTGGAKFRPDAYCVPPGGDPFAGVHVKSLTRDGQATVTGTRFARWRWTPPPGTGITAVRGTWWHALHDGIEQRLGAVNWGGGFEPFLAAGSTDAALREFSRGFPAPVAAFEDRLLCARAESKWCALDQGSWSSLRGLTITVDDPTAPGAWMTGGDLVAGGWRRGTQSLLVAGYDAGAGVRFGETRLDGARVGLTEYPCAMVSVGGEWRGTRMQPCLTTVSQTHAVSTSSFSDGPHTLVHCTTDFAANAACTPSRTVLIDNNPPAHPKTVAVAGGEGWRRVDDFDLSWENPGQGPASPIAGAPWRLVGGNGYDSGVRFAAGRDRRALANVSVPAAGSYSLQLWLRDEAGNEAPSTAVTVPLRFDDLKPEVAFADGEPQGQVRAEVADAHSGPGSGQILYRRVDAASWTELPTKLAPGGEAGAATLVAPMPELGLGSFVFRADATDAAGNAASTGLHADGTQMAVRRVPAPHAPRAKSRLFARLRGGHGQGDALTVPFGAPALLSGRLTRAADGAGLGGREVRVVSRPSRGALVPAGVATATTGPQGGFELRLPPGPSRRVSVVFGGDGGLEESSRQPLELRVRSGVSLRAAPRALRTEEVVRLRGKVSSRGAPIPRRGKLIAIQYLEEETRRWRPVLVTRSDHHGRFRAHYRFRYVSGRAAIRLRATALAEERWPYAPGSSAPVTVEVRGS